MSRPPGTELLDDPAADPGAVRTSLRNIARANRWFGGTAAAVYGVERLLAEGAKSEVRPAEADAARARAPRTSHLARRTSVSLLDLGTGAGDIPAALRRWAGAEGFALRTFGLERLRPAAALAQGRGLPVALGCATALPMRSGGVDIVLASQLLHHFDRAAAIRILREGARVARRGVVVADLLRSPVAARLFGVGARALGFDAHTVNDGITSVGRGYELAELLELFAAAGLEAWGTTRPGWRVVAWGRGGGAAS